MAKDQPRLVQCDLTMSTSVGKIDCNSGIGTITGCLGPEETDQPAVAG
jgi:hypothetical protein